MKTTIFSFFILAMACMPTYLLAQQEDSKPPIKSNHYFKLDFTGGANIDVPPPANAENRFLLSSRASVAPFFGVKASHLFSDKFGWYASLRIDYYDEKRTESVKPTWVDDFFENVFDDILGSIPPIKPAVEAGMLYRIEKNRWGIYPNIGIGYASHGADRNRTRSETNNDKQNILFSYEQKASFLTANVGLSADFHLSPKGYITMRAGFQQPLQASSATLTQEIDGVSTTKSYKTTDAGRNIYVGIGYGFILGKKGRMF